MFDFSFDFNVIKLPMVIQFSNVCIASSLTSNLIKMKAFDFFLFKFYNFTRFQN